MTDTRRARRAAGADWAFISDASALAVLVEDEPASSDCPLPRVRCVELVEVRNDGTPRDPVDVARQFAAVLKRWHVESLCSDAHYRASWQPALADEGIDWVAAPTRPDDIAESFLLLRLLLQQDRLTLPRSPRLKRQLADVVARAAPGGGLAVASKRRKDAGGGTTHGDLVSALVAGLWRLGKSGADYVHRGAPSRTAGTDPRRRGDLAQSFAGIPRGEFSEFAEPD